uniref:RING-type domain-containing protein n=2 Tax=Caenorhabditis tropicalis TaxID=1561998 RepID=A0A1I7TGS5_9PELO
MSKYLETPDDVLTSLTLLISLSGYMLDELTSTIKSANIQGGLAYIKDNGKELIQKILDNSNNQLRMYGSAEEFTENLKIYRDFPFSHDFFKSEMEPFYAPAVLYDNLKGEKFISKLDLLIVLQNMAMKIFPGSNSIEVRISIFSPLKTHAKKLSSSMKFVKFDEKWFEEIEKQMKEAAKSCIVHEFELAQLEKQIAAGNFSDFASKFPRFDGKQKTKTDEAEICNLMKKYYDNLGPHDRAGRMALFFTKTLIMKCLLAIIEKYPKMFSGNGVSAVRVFEDGTQRFETHLFTTISMEEVERIYGHRVKNIVFLRTSIIRARHRAARVTGFVNGEYGLLATDALFEVLRTLLIGGKLFQKWAMPDWEVIADTFDVLFEILFKQDCKTPYFIRDGALNLVSSVCDDINKAVPFIIAKDIRNAKIDGFTVQNLKNELIHLGLTMAFPEIVNYAEAVYLAVDGLKKGKYLSTSDLFEAVFHSQLICIFDRIPKFKTFLHNQNGCGRLLGYFCELCQKASDDQKTSDQKSIETSDKMEEKTLKSSEQPKSLESLEYENKTISLKEFEEMKQKILELENENRQLKEQNSRFSNEVEELKLEKLSIDSEEPSTNFSVISTKTSILECLICDSELDTTGETKKCPMCRTRFHSKHSSKMSKYLKDTDHTVTMEILLKNLTAYVLPELKTVLIQPMCLILQQNRFVREYGLSAIRQILNNSNQQLRMYGTAEEFAENLKIFRDFPCAHEFFKTNKFLSSAVLYDNLKGEKFISKLDLHIVLQNMALKIFSERCPAHIRDSVLSLLEEHIQKYSSSLEFVKFDEKWFEEMEKQIGEAEKFCPVFKYDYAQVKRQLTSGDFTRVVSKIPRFVSKPRTKSKENAVCDILKYFYGFIGQNDRPELLDGFIVLTILNEVTAVRVFEDGTQRFVMKAELFNAISNSVGNKFKEDPNLFTTISMEEVERIYGHRVKHVEFFPTPITRAKHRAVPVKGYTQQEFGILATDHLLENFHDLIIGQKIFQKFKNRDWSILSGMFEAFSRDFYNPDCKTPYFICKDAKIQATYAFGSLLSTIEPLPAKDIRNAKIDGFTLQNLKNELNHLGLTMAFPEVVDHAEAVYSAVDRLKKGKYLSTSDLFEAVFHSQLVCIVNRMDKLKTFLHNQNGCGRVLGYTCELCQKMSDDQDTSDQKSIDSTKNNKMLKSVEQTKSLESSENKENKSLSLKEFEEMKQKIMELEDENRQLKEQNSRFSNQMEELKLEKLSIDSENPSTNFSVVSTKTSISECLICDSELDTTGETKKCPMCRTRFHSKCAIEYIKHEIKCPSCKGTLQNSMITPKFS